MSIAEDAKWGFLKNIINIDRFFANEGGDSPAAASADAKSTTPASAAQTVKNAPPVYDSSKDITIKSSSQSSGKISSKEESGPNSLAVKPVKRSVCKDIVVDDGEADDGSPETK